MTLLADSHLTYIGSYARYFGETRYDVYPREGGPQLGWVVKGRRHWVAVPNDGVKGVVGRTRREAATALWGVA